MSEVKAVPQTDNSMAFPWEKAAGSQTEGQAAKSLFENPGSDLAAVMELAEKPAGSKKPASEEEETPDESDEVDADAEHEDEESEDSGDDTDEADDSEDAEETDDADDADLIEVTLPGGEKIKVTHEEAALGYSRTEDYTRKRQRDANEHAVAMQGVREARDQYEGKLEKLGELLTKLGPAKPDAALRKSNPGEYAAQKAEYDEYQEQIAGVGSAREEISEARKAELIEWRNDRIAEARENLVTAVPEWKDARVMQEDLGKLGEFLKTEWKFTPEELDRVADPRLVLMARENMRQREATKQGREKIGEKRSQRAASRLKPGSSADRPKGSKQVASKKAIDLARKRLAETGSVRDAARSIELELGDIL